MRSISHETNKIQIYLCVFVYFWVRIRPLHCACFEEWRIDVILCDDQGRFSLLNASLHNLLNRIKRLDKLIMQLIRFYCIIMLKMNWKQTRQNWCKERLNSFRLVNEFLFSKVRKKFNNKASENKKETHSQVAKFWLL